MTIPNYLFLIKKRLLGSRWMLYFNIGVSSLAMAFLCGAAVVMPQILHHSENDVKQALEDDMSKFGVIRNSGSDLYDKNLSGYVSDIYHAPEIAGVGAWTYFGAGHLATVNRETDYWNEILEIQNSHVREFDESPDEVQMVYMPTYAFQINRLELYSGSDGQVGSNMGYLMYLGYHFRDVPIGTVFQDEKHVRYTVVGILKEGASIVDAPQLLQNLGGMKLGCSVEMDNMVLLLEPCDGENYFSPIYFFKCADGYAYEEAAAKIKEISEKYRIQVAVGTLQKRVRDVLSDITWLSDGIAGLSAVLFPAAFVMLLVTQMLTIMLRKDELGVWLLSGMDKKDVFRILLGENMIKTVISAMVAYGVVSVFEKIAYASAGISDSVIYRLGYISRIQVPVFLLACSGLTALLCSVIPTVYVGKRSIPDIVRGTWR